MDEEGFDVMWLEMILLSMLVLSAVAAISTRDLLVSVILLSAFSFFAALTYAFLNALDVAFIEAVVGALTTVFLVAAFYRTDRRASR